LAASRRDRSAGDSRMSFGGSRPERHGVKSAPRACRLRPVVVLTRAAEHRRKGRTAGADPEQDGVPRRKPCFQREWDCGNPGDAYPCWIVALAPSATWRWRTASNASGRRTHGAPLDRKRGRLFDAHRLQMPRAALQLERSTRTMSLLDG
jgi:hypothetical protein